MALPAAGIGSAVPSVVNHVFKEWQKRCGHGEERDRRL